MLTYEEYLEEAKSKPVVFTFGRFNPVTSGHEIMIKDVIKQAKSRGGNPLIFTSQTQDSKKNPLSYKDKIKFLKHFWGRIIIKDTSIKTAFDALEWLSKKGYKNVTLVVGSDRVERFEKYMRPYVKTYGFDDFEVVQAGVTRGVGNEMSASKMRKAAADGDFESYKEGMPSGADNTITKTIYDAVRKGLGVKEEALEFGTNRTTKKYVSMTPGETFTDDKIDENAMQTFSQYLEEANSKYIVSKNPNDKKWYVMGHVGNNKWMPVSNGFKNKTQAQKWAKSQDNVDSAARGEISGA